MTPTREDIETAIAFHEAEKRHARHAQIRHVHETTIAALRMALDGENDRRLGRADAMRSAIREELARHDARVTDLFARAFREKFPDLSARYEAIASALRVEVLDGEG